MGNYPGITPEGLWLLAENRFRDSKTFYEESKPKIRTLVIEPLRALQEDLAPFMLRIDPRFVVEPNRNNSISRVRRDNRFSKDKSMYRENMWLAFERDKKAWTCMPGFFFEISPRGALWGMGFYQTPPAFLQFLRRRIDASSAPFVTAAEKAQKAGFVFDAPPYARPKKPDASPALDGLYNRKGIDLSKAEPDTAFFGDPDLAGVLSKEFAVLEPLYRLLAGAAEAWIETGKE